MCLNDLFQPFYSLFKAQILDEVTLLILGLVVEGWPVLLRVVETRAQGCFGEVTPAVLCPVMKHGVLVELFPVFHGFMPILLVLFIQDIFKIEHRLGVRDAVGDVV